MTERKVINDFVVDSNGHCFLCLDPISKSEAGLSIHSIRYLSHYLKMNMKKVFNPRKGPIPAHLLEKVKRSRLKVELCGECAGLTEKFSELYRKLEKIKIEMGSNLGDIQEKLVKADQTGRIEKFLSSGRSSDQLEMVGILRTEAKKKCSQRLRAALPRVRIPAPAPPAKPKLKRGRPPKAKSSKSGSGGAPKSQKIAKLETVKKYRPPQSKKGSLIVIYPKNKLSRSHMRGQWSFNPLNGKRKCSLCSYECNTGPAFHNHFQKVHRKVQFKCSLCGKMFPYRSSWVTHNQTVHMGVRYNCLVCGRDFTTKSYLLKHQQQFCMPGRRGRKHSPRKGVTRGKMVTESHQQQPSIHDQSDAILKTAEVIDLGQVKREDFIVPCKTEDDEIDPLELCDPIYYE